MNRDDITLNRKEVSELLNELQLNASTLSQLTATYEDMHADFLANEDCPSYIDNLSLGAIQRGIIALAGVVDRSVFELDCVVRQAGTVSCERVSG